jgi:hypothetical protein
MIIKKRKTTSDHINENKNYTIKISYLLVLSSVAISIRASDGKIRLVLNNWLWADITWIPLTLNLFH